MNEQAFNKIFSKNLNVYMNRDNLSQVDLAKAIGVSTATASNWCNGIKSPRMDKVDKMCEYFRIKRSDLMEDKSSVDTTSSHKGIRINVYGSVPAGIPVEAIPDIVDWEEIPVEWTKGGQEYMALKIKGDSMFPKYLEGDIVIVRLQPDCESGQDCIVYVNGYDATLKKVIKKQDCIILQPLNPVYDPKVYDYNDEKNKVEILGVVVQIRRNV